MKKLFAVLALALGLFGCASIGAPAPKTFMEGVVAAQLSVTTVLQSTTQLLNAGLISVADAKNTADTVKKVNEGIGVAVTAYQLACPGAVPTCAAPSTASAKLTAMVSLLSITSSYLQTKGKP